MLERVIETLKSQGFEKIVVNIHHFAPMIREFLKSRDLGVEIAISDESDGLLDTGGGIVKALPELFNGDGKPVLVHNVDIISNADLRGLMAESEKECGFGATLLVSDRDSSRKLIFDEKNELKGWRNLQTGEYRPDNLKWGDEMKEFSFSGIYTIGEECALEMKRLHGEGKFSIIEYFVNPMRKNAIRGIVADGLELIDIGKPASLERASQLFKYFPESN